MGTYLVRRLIYAVAVVVGVSVFVFFITHVLGDPVKLMLPLEATQEQYEQAKEVLGYNDPLLVQFFRFAGNALRGDFGDSLWQKVPALPLVLERLPATFLLAGTAVFIATLVAIPLGVLAALRPRSWLDHLCTTTSLFGMCIADFWLGLMLILIFPVSLGLF